MKTINKEIQSRLTPAQALELLKQGNNRFINNLKINRNLLQQVNETWQGQYPTAVILSCIDSRTSAELIFDQGLGDIFSIRVAGNILNDDGLGSMEYACKIAGAKIIVVLGHTHCGAIKGAIDGLQMGYITQLLKKIQPSVIKARQTLQIHPELSLNLTDRAAECNVRNTMQQIIAQSEILDTLLKNEEIALVGGLYNVESGQVTFYEESLIKELSGEKKRA